MECFLQIDEKNRFQTVNTVRNRFFFTDLYIRNLAVFEAMFSHDFTSLQTACETANPGSLCSQSVCKTEMTFAIKASANSIAGESSAEFVHDNGFDPSSDQVCATVRLKMSLKF